MGTQQDVGPRSKECVVAVTSRMERRKVEQGKVVLVCLDIGPHEHLEAHLTKGRTHPPQGRGKRMQPSRLCRPARQAYIHSIIARHRAERPKLLVQGSLEPRFSSLALRPTMRPLVGRQLSQATQYRSSTPRFVPGNPSARPPVPLWMPPAGVARAPHVLFSEGFFSWSFLLMPCWESHNAGN